MSRKTFTAFFVLAVAARAAWIWVPQLWYDENFTLLLARLPFDRMMTAVMGDVHPPLWYMIEWGWLCLFPDPLTAPVWTMRIPALIFSVLALFPFRALLNEMWIPPRVQTGAMVLMAILPMQIWYAQEARMYSLLLLLVLLALLFAIRYQWVELSIVTTAMLYTQNYGVIYAACVGMIVFIKDICFIGYQHEFGHRVGLQKTFEPTRRALIAMLCSALCYLPWLHVLTTQMHYIDGRYWIQPPMPGDVLYTVYRLFWQSAMPGFALLSGIMVTFAMISLGLIHLHRDHHPDERTVLIMAFGPLLIAWIVSLIWNPILLHRALIGSSPFLYIIVAWPLDELMKRSHHLHGQHVREVLIALVLIAPVMVSGVVGYYKNIPAMKNDGAISSLQDALIYVRAHWQPGDILYMTDDGPAVNLMPYASDLPMYGMSACGSDSYGLVLGSLNPSTRDAIGIVVHELDEVEYRRAWVFAPRSPLHPKCYEEHIAPITHGDPLITVDDNPYIFSGVWLVEKK